MLFKERAKIAQELLDKQPPVTLEIVLAQIQWLKEQSISNDKKQIPKTEEKAK